MTHVVIPEGLNRPEAASPLSDYYEACLRRVASLAATGDTVYLAPGNPFGHSRPEDEIAAGFLRGLRPDLITLRVPDAFSGRYLDTLDNATCLRDWIERQGRWPLPDCRLYCTRMHVFRTWLCFRISGYRPRQIISSMPARRSGLIAPRLKYYDFGPAHACYELLAVGYTLLRLARNLVRSGSLLPFEDRTS